MHVRKVMHVLFRASYLFELNKASGRLIVPSAFAPAAFAGDTSCMNEVAISIFEDIKKLYVYEIPAQPGGGQLGACSCMISLLT